MNTYAGFPKKVYPFKLKLFARICISLQTECNNCPNVLVCVSRLRVKLDSS